MNDPKGTFLTAPRLDVDWSPFDYVNNHVNVHSVASQLITLRRNPELKETPPGDENAPFLPRSGHRHRPVAGRALRDGTAGIGRAPHRADRRSGAYRGSPRAAAGRRSDDQRAGRRGRRRRAGADRRGPRRRQARHQREAVGAGGRGGVRSRRAEGAADGDGRRARQLEGVERPCQRDAGGGHARRPRADRTQRAFRDPRRNPPWPLSRRSGRAPDRAGTSGRDRQHAERTQGRYTHQARLRRAVGRCRRADRSGEQHVRQFRDRCETADPRRDRAQRPRARRAGARRAERRVRDPNGGLQGSRGLARVRRHGGAEPLCPRGWRG